MKASTNTGIIAIFLLTLSSFGYADADAGKGYKLAADMCTRCHDISSGGAFKEYPPSFAAIAVYRPVDEIYGRIIYPTLHPYMPEFGLLLSPENIHHLVAYIQSLDVE